MRIGMSWEFLLMGGVSRWWLFSFLVELDLSLMVEFIDQAKAIFGVTTADISRP